MALDNDFSGKVALVRAVVEGWGERWRSRLLNVEQI